MIRHYFSPAKILGCVLLIAVGFAKADITQCIDETGVVLYTDGSCNDKADVVQITPAANAPEVEAKNATSSENFTDSVAITEGVWARNRANTRKVAVDVETMKAARSTMLAMDQSHLSQHRNLIALDQRNGSWFDFR